MSELRFSKFELFLLGVSAVYGLVFLYAITVAPMMENYQEHGSIFIRGAE